MERNKSIFIVLLCAVVIFIGIFFIKKRNKPSVESPSPAVESTSLSN